MEEAVRSLFGRSIDSRLWKVASVDETKRKTAAMLKLETSQLFAHYIDMVEIEISAACNRRCEYCPQSLIGRPQELMPVEMFLDAVICLKKLNFQGTLAFHQYNEPLLAGDHLFTCINLVKKHLPTVKTAVFTNGALLTPGRVQAPARAGVAKLTVSRHWGNGETWDHDRAMADIADRGGRLGVRFGLFDPAAYCVEARVRDMLLQVKAPDLRTGGSSRLGTVNTARRGKTTPRVCHLMFRELHIAYSGTAYICCECSCEGVPDFAPYALASLKDTSLLGIFEAKLPYMRDYLFGALPKACRVCNGWDDEEP